MSAERPMDGTGKSTALQKFKKNTEMVGMLYGLV
jgi:thymidylate kinase